MSLVNQPATLVSAAIYLLVVLGIGVWSVRRTRTSKDFFIAGQDLGLVVTALATMASALSGFAFVGGPGLTYQMGLSALFIFIPIGYSSGLLCWGLAKRLRLLSAVRETFTVPDAILHRYDSRTASGLAALAVLVGTVGYLGAQVLAAGILLDSILGLQTIFGQWSLHVGVAIGLMVILFYAVAGGMVAGVYTDLFQGTVMVGAAIAVFFYAMKSGGGLASITTAIATSEQFGPRFLDPLGNVPLYTAAGFFFVFGVGVLGQPHMLHKFYMLDDPRKLKWIPLVFGTTQGLCFLVWIGIGIAVPALVATDQMPALSNPDEATPLFLLQFVPKVLAGIVFAGILAAIMSTADSFVNIGSAALVRDLPKALGWRVHDELFWGRWAVVGIGVLSAVVALAYGDLIALLGTFAYGTFAAALAPALAVGLNWKRVTPLAASASIMVGMVLNLSLEFLAKQTYWSWLPRPPLPDGVLPSAVALSASFLTLFVVTWVSGRSRESSIAEDVALVMDL